MFGESLLYFTTTKLLTIKNKRVGLFNTILQMGILSYILWDLIHHELYKKVEVPSGYTTFWTENGNLTQIQKDTDFNQTIFCQNETYNYAYDTEEWIYTDFKCINLPYAEMYEKGESEFFFLTHFTEYDINVEKCTNSSQKCINSNSQDYFTIGSEGMLLAFDHFYTTTFEQGSNLGNSGLKLIDTYIKDIDGNIKYVFPQGETIKLYVKDWLDLAGTSLDSLNTGTPVSQNHPKVPYPNLPYNRMSGIEIIIKVNYHNIEYFSGYDSPTCEINIQPNTGWASKGSQINYLTYPNISDSNDSYNYIDRYRYGIKFKFIVSGLMGVFNMNSLITHLVSGIVLVNMSTVIVAMYLMYFTGNYGKYFSKLRYTTTNIKVPCYKKCCPNYNYPETDTEDTEDTDTESTDIYPENNLRRRKPQPMVTKMVTQEIPETNIDEILNSSEEDLENNKSKIEIKDIKFNKLNKNEIVVSASIV